MIKGIKVWGGVILGLCVVLISTAWGQSYRFSMQEVEGTVIDLLVEKASPQAAFGFVTAVVEAGNERIKVRLYPQWWEIRLPFERGDRVRVKGWIPPRAALAGQPILVAAEVESLDTGETLVLRNGPGGPGWRGGGMNPTYWRAGLNLTRYTGAIVSRKESPGIRRPQIKWLVIEVKNSEGRVATFRISPLWLNDYPELKPGEEVEIWAYRPPFWVARNIEEYMACRVILLKDGRTLNLRGCPQGSNNN